MPQLYRSPIYAFFFFLPTLLSANDTQRCGGSPVHVVSHAYAFPLAKSSLYHLDRATMPISFYAGLLISAASLFAKRLLVLNIDFLQNHSGVFAFSFFNKTPPTLEKREEDEIN